MNAAMPHLVDRSHRLGVAVVGSSERAASAVRLLADADYVAVVAVADRRSGPALRLAEELGAFVTTDLSELFQVPSLDVIVDLADETGTHEALLNECPRRIHVISGPAAVLVYDLLRAKKRGEEQEKLFVELQVAYEKIRGHERRLQSGKEALESANEELESRLAEIFFTHEFFKALTSFSTVEDVTSLIVDGANGILGAEISAVYLHDGDDCMRLAAVQGRPVAELVETIALPETIVGRAVEDGMAQESDVAPGDPSAAWYRDANEIRSQIAVVLRAGDEFIGVLVIGSANYRAFEGAEVDRLQVIANQASLALQNALLHEELERLSVTDRLTELYNHGYFQQRLDEEIGRAVRFSHPLALVMMDLDDFKSFNDTHGHPVGDVLLRHVSRIIRENLREMDVAARYGGEEFVVVLPETDLEGARKVAERIRRGLEEEPVDIEGVGRVGRTVSLGVAVFPVDAATPSRLIEAADRAMYRAKRAGKNRTTAIAD
jgi:diguanylate cyclase (GGDEF)-like protein